MSCLAKASVEACSLDQIIEPTQPSRYVMSPEAINEVPIETQLGWAVADIEASVARGNDFVREALETSKRTKSAFEDDQSGTFAAESVLLSAALTDAAEALDHAGTEARSWRGYPGVGAAVEEAPHLHFALRRATDDLGEFLDDALGLPISDAKGAPDARVDSMALVAHVHMKSGDRLDAGAAELAGTEGEQAALGGRALAMRYAGEEATVQGGTEPYYIGRMERSEASDQAKAHFVFHAGAHESPYYGSHDPELEECALNDVGLDAMTRHLEQASEARIREASVKLRTADPPLGPDFTQDAGKLTTLLATTPGDKARLRLAIDAPLTAPGQPVAAGLHLEFDSEIENDDGQYKLTSKLAIGVFGEVDVKIGSVRAALAALGTLEARGDTGREVWDLIRFGLREAVVGENRWARRVFDGHAPFELGDSLDPDDYVEVAAGFKAEVGGSLGVGDEKDEAGVRYEQVWGTRYEKDARGGMKETGFRDFTAVVAASVGGGFGGELKWKARKPERGPIRDQSLEYKASAKMSFDDIVEKLGDSKLVVSIVAQALEYGADIARLATRKGKAKMDDGWVEKAKRGSRALAVDKTAFAALDRRLGDAGSVARDVSLSLGVDVSGGKTTGKFAIELTNALEMDFAGGAVELGIETSRKLVEREF